MNKKQTQKQTGSEAEINSKKRHHLVLHNDEVHSFDDVIEALIDVCKHNSLQAEQCAMITHFRGKCDVEQGTFEFLNPLREALIAHGLQVSIV